VGFWFFPFGMHSFRFFFFFFLSEFSLQLHCEKSGDFSWVGKTTQGYLKKGEENHLLLEATLLAYEIKKDGIGKLKGKMGRRN